MIFSPKNLIRYMKTKIDILKRIEKLMEKELTKKDGILKMII